MAWLGNMKTRLTAMRLGLSLMAGGVGFKGMDESILNALQRLLMSRWGEPPRRDARQWLELFGKSPRMNPIHKIAQDVAAAEWRLYIGGKKDRQVIESHPLVDLLKNPNPLPEFTGFLMMYLTEVYLLLNGEAFWLIERNGMNRPTELWIVPPHWVVQTPSLTQPFFRVFPQGNTGSASVLIAPEDVVFFKEPDPLSPYGRGLGRAHGVSDEIETDEYMAKYAKRFFFNDAKPPIVIEAEGADKAAVDRIKEQWMERYSGWKNAHKPAVLPWKANIKELGSSHKEMDFVESRRFLRDTVNQHFMIPPEILGIIENSNRATIDAADYLYKDGVLSARLRLIQDVIQVQLVPQFDEKLIFEFENVVPEDKEFELKKANEGLQRGAITVNEWRQANGYDPLPQGGDVLYVPINVIPTEKAGQDSLPPGDGKGKRMKILSPDQRASIWHQFDKAAVKYENNMQTAVSKFFSQQKEKMLSNFDSLSQKSVGKTDDGEDGNTFDIPADELVEKLIDWTEENNILMGVLKPQWLAAMQEGNKVADESFMLGVGFDVILPEMLGWITAEGATLIKGINDTTKESLRSTIADGIVNGESIPNIRKRIQETMDNASKSRAEMIARTETHGSVSRGTFATYKQAGVEKKEWLTTLDGRERPSHHIINGEVKPIDKPFSNGLMHPGGAGPAKEVVRCRCALLPVLDEA